MNQPINGIVRPIDENGRISVPREFCKILGIGRPDEAVCTLEGDSICIRKHSEQCVFCSERENLIGFLGKKICGGCADRVREVLLNDL